MATATAKKNQDLLILPAPITPSSSCTFLKKLTGTAISTIVYARNLFNENDFCNKQFEGVEIKVVKGTPDNSNAAQCLSSWLEGAFHAIDNKFLKCLVFEIRDESEYLLETYSFQYTYEGDKTQCTLDAGDKSKVALMEVDGPARLTVRNLLRNISIMTSSMPLLPAKCITSVKINYYDEVTPADYEPPGFKAFVGNPSDFNGPAHKWNCGTVKTPFHSMTFRTTQLINNVVIINLTGEAQTVQCLCKMTDDIGLMLKCDKCGTVQHAACYKIWTQGQQSHECFKCGNITLEKDFEATECVFRRVLISCLKTKTLSVLKLRQTLHLDPDSALLHMRRLQREGALLKSTQPLTLDKTDFLYTLNKNQIMQALKLKYFN